MKRRKCIYAHPVHELSFDQREELLDTYDEIILINDNDPELADQLMDCSPDRMHLLELADILYKYAKNLGADLVQPGGSLAFQFMLGTVQRHDVDKWSDRGCRGVTPSNVLYAYSKRESVETVLSDGSIEKKSIFRHLGFNAM